MATSVHSPLCITPPMFALKVPPFTVSCTNFWTGCPPFQAFDHTAGGSAGWVGDGAAPKWLKIDVGAGRSEEVAAYTLTSQRDWSACTPAAWVLEGSNDDSSWTTLDTQTGRPNNGVNYMTTYAVASRPGPFRYFRISISAANGDYPGIGELELLRSYVPVPTLPFRGRSLLR